MLSDFIAVFLAAVVGATVAGTLMWRSRPPEQRHRGTAVLNILGIATAMSASQLLFGVFPQLNSGWIRVGIVAVVAAVVYMPFSFVIGRLRRKRTHVP